MVCKSASSFLCLSSVVHHFLCCCQALTPNPGTQVPADMLEKHSKVCCLLDEEEAQDHSLDARLTK